jgi:hypothetical protein
VSVEPLHPLAAADEVAGTHARFWPRFLALAVVSVLLIPTLLFLNDSPAPWWDEGWTMLVARHWVEDGFYGRLPTGGAEGPGLSAAFPTTALVALSFRLLGVGVWQARLPSVILTIISQALLYALTCRLYDRRVAWGALAIVLFTTSLNDVNPVYAGRQVLAEPMQICALLGGYLAFLFAARRPWLGWPLALLLWGLALIAKGQTLPFWVASLILPLGLALFRRKWRIAATLTVALAGGWLASQLLNVGIDILLAGRTAAAAPLPGLTSAVALAFVVSARNLALTVLLAAGMPAVLGVAWASWRALRDARVVDLANRRELTRMMLLALVGCWMLWYALLAVGWARYAYPVLVLSSPFAAALASELTGGFSLRATMERAIFSRRRSNRAASGAIVALALAAILVPLTFWQLYISFTAQRDAAVFRVIDYLNVQTSSDAVIESCETELFPFLKRSYHYPPDITNVFMIRHIYYHEEVDYDYDPLVANPDYLVIGACGRSSGLYDAVLARGAFRLIHQDRLYDIYARVR